MEKREERARQTEIVPLVRPFTGSCWSCKRTRIQICSHLNSGICVCFKGGFISPELSPLPSLEKGRKNRNVQIVNRDKQKVLRQKRRKKKKTILRRWEGKERGFLNAFPQSTWNLRKPHPLVDTSSFFIHLHFASFRPLDASETFDFVWKSSPLRSLEIHFFFLFRINYSFCKHL